MASVLEYRDYRDYLRIRLKELKASDSKYTYRYIASELGLKSAGHVTQMVKGSSRISGKVMPLILKLLKLTRREESYFKLLVEYGQAAGMDDKRALLAKISRFSGERAVKVSREQYEFYQKWYYAAIRDILAIYPFDGDYRKLAHMVEPSVSPTEARSAIRILERLQLINRDENGVWRASSSVLSLDLAEDSTVVLSGFASQMIDRASYALNRLPKSERTISWAGFSASLEAFRLIQDEIRQFRRRVMEIIRGDQKPSRVYHLNIHCFPLSKKLDEE